MEVVMGKGVAGIWWQSLCRQVLFWIKPLFSATQPRGEENLAVINQRAEKLLDLYGSSVLRLAYSYLHNKSDAEDILQEAFIRFLKAAPVLESEEHEKAWLLRVAANLSKNRIGYNKTRKTDELADELTESLAAEEKPDLAFVWEAVKSLPETYREAIHLFHYEGYSTAEIAKILDRKEATVRSDLRRGREKLKSILKEEYDFAEI